jgi:triosephosphate isomerase
MEEALSPHIRPLIAGNWKMHKTVAESVAYIDALRKEQLPDGIEVAIAPPFTALATVAFTQLQRQMQGSQGTDITLAAQDMYWENSGAFTGEISPRMLTEFSVRYVIIGHSERRQYFGETDADVNRKVQAALASGLIPIVCVGESLAERDAGEACGRVTAQTRAAFEGAAINENACIVAYEPIWAIGTGRNCDPDEADATMRVIRESVPGLQNARILYGGSAKTENIAAYMQKENINGSLVGGASLDAHGFAELIRAAAQ